LLIDLLI